MRGRHPPSEKRGRPLKTTLWDVADHLDTEEAIALFLEAAAEENDPLLMAAALKDVERARQRR